MSSKLKQGLLGIASLILILFIVSIVKSAKGKSSQDEYEITQPYTSGNPAGPTIETLSARLEERASRENEIEQELDDLKKSNKAQLDKFSQDMEDKLDKQAHLQSSSLEEAISQIKSLVNETKRAQAEQFDVNDNQSSDSFVWVGSVSTATYLPTDNQKREPTEGWDDFKPENNSSSQSNKSPSSQAPYLTINRNATLMDATLMGPLIGRIPVNGKIDDPYPFKVILGKENLAANGYDIPGLEGIVASGFAKGDMALSCARGEVTSLTFIFPDGTISTSATDSAELAELRSSNTLGYLANKYGNPCIRGEFKTNASKYLVDRMLVSGIEGAGDAISASQTTTDRNSDGSKTSFLSGSMGKYIGGQVASNSANEAGEWLRSRQENSLDVVFVPSGQDIVVNITKEIHIDKNLNGRKISYVQNSQSTTHELD